MFEWVSNLSPAASLEDLFWLLPEYPEGGVIRPLACLSNPLPNSLLVKLSYLAASRFESVGTVE
jgi:hypothetical protein